MNKENVFVIDDPSLIGWVEDGVTADGDPIWKWDQEGSSGGSAGAGMIICSEAELPLVSERVTGMQWLDSESSNVYVWDDDKWLMFPATGGQGAPGADGTGSSVHIGDTPPVDPQEGQQWMEVPVSGDAIMWIYDGANWLEQPGGKDGADGVGGGDSLWTDNGGSISYSAGNVGIGVSNPQNSLHLKSAIQVESPSGNHAWIDKQDAALIVHAGNGSELDLKGDTFKLETPNGDSRLTINSAGRTSLFASNEKYGLQLNKTDVTDGPFLGSDGEDVFVVSTHGGLERFRLEANGDATFSGTVNSHSSVWNNNGGLSCDGNKRILPYNADGQPEDGTYNLGRDTTGGVGAYRFKDAYFTGTVNTGVVGAADVYANALHAAHWRENNANVGLALTSGHIFAITGDGSAARDGDVSLGNTTARFHHGYFAGTVNANQTFTFRESGLNSAGNAVISAKCHAGASTASWGINVLDSNNAVKGGIKTDGLVYSRGNPVTTSRDLIETLSTLRNATKDETTIKGLRDAIGNAVGGLIEKFEALQSEAVTQEISDE